MSSLLKIRPILSVILKRYKTTTPANAEIPSLVKLKKLQTKFQADNGKPIFLKGGATDHILYNITIAGCALGLAMFIHFIYVQAKPPQ